MTSFALFLNLLCGHRAQSFCADSSGALLSALSLWRSRIPACPVPTLCPPPSEGRRKLEGAFAKVIRYLLSLFSYRFFQVPPPVQCTISKFFQFLEVSCECSNPVGEVCFPLQFNDGIDRGFGGDCFPFLRSFLVLNTSCDANAPREQLNSITAYVDASQVYGSEDELAERLRDHTPAAEFGRGDQLERKYI